MDLQTQISKKDTGKMYLAMLNDHFREPCEIACLSVIKVVLQGYPSCPNSHDLSECHHPYGLGRHLPPISITVSSLTTKNHP